MDEMNQNAGQENYFDPYAESPKSKMPIVLAVIAVIAVIGLICAYFFVFSSPKNVYLDLEKRNAEAFINGFEEFEKSNLGKLLIPDETKPLKAGVELSANIDLEESNEIIDLLNKSKFEMIQYQDLEEEYNLVNMNLILDNKEFLNADLLMDKNMAGIFVKDLVDKYFVADTQNLKPLYEKIGYTEEAPNRILTNKELKEKVSFTDSEMKTLEKELKKYSEIFTDNLDEENIKIEKNVEILINGETVKCNSIKVTFTPEFLMKSSKEVLETLKEDEKLLELLFRKYETLMEVYKDAGYPMEENVTKQDFIQALDDLLEEMKAADIEELSNLVMNIHYNNKKEIIQRELHLEDDVNPIIFTNYSDKDMKYYAIESNGQVISDEITVAGDKEIHDILIVDTKIKAEVEKVNKNKTDVEITAEDLAGFVVNTSLYKENNKIVLDAIVKFAVLNQSMQFNTSLYVAENEKFDKVDLSKQEQIDIVKLSETELQKELETIMTKVQNWSEKHNDVIMTLMSSYNPYAMYY